MAATRKNVTETQKFDNSARTTKRRRTDLQENCAPSSCGSETECPNIGNSSYHGSNQLKVCATPKSKQLSNQCCVGSAPMIPMKMVPLHENESTPRKVVNSKEWRLAHLEESDHCSLQQRGPEDRYPLVFYCAKCEAIFGDSSDYLRHDERLRTITLKHCTNKVQKDEVFSSSLQGPDIGSAFIKLICASCNTDVGVSYLTTPKHMDDLRDLFTFHVDKIEYYEIGRCSASVAVDAGHEISPKSGTKRAIKM